MLTAQQQTRGVIDQLLTAAGWAVQDYKTVCLRAAAEIYFHNDFDAELRARKVFAFHRPKTLVDGRPRLRPASWAPPASLF